MSAGKARRYLWPAVVLSLASGATVALAAGWLLPGTGLGWALGGWSAAALIGVTAGAWLASCHGRPGLGFVVALLAGMLARLLAAGAGAALAAWTGGGALWAFVLGFATGFTPLQVWEAVFFHRETRISGSGAEPTGPGRREPPRIENEVTG